MAESPIAQFPRNPAPDSVQNDADARLRRQNQVLVDLARRESIHSGDLPVALRELAMAAAATLDVPRVGIWLYSDDRLTIECVEMYRRDSIASERGMQLRAADYPAYFDALESERTISAHDALTDPRTSAFGDSYLRPNGITSLLDAPIRRLGRMTGIVCHEHVGESRFWTIEEENFASSIADLVALAIDAAERREAQDSLRHRVELEQLISSISTQFVNLSADEAGAAIEEALGKVGTFVGADSCHVVLLTDRDHATLEYEWLAPGVPSRRSMIRDTPIAAFPWSVQVLSGGSNVVVCSLDELPDDAAPERRLHEAFGYQAVIAIPMIFGRSLLGYVGANARETRHWSDETVALLRIAGEIFAGALERMKTERILRQSEQRHRLLFERNLAGVYRNTVSGRMLECNDALVRILGFESREDLLNRRAGDLYFDRSERERFIAKVREKRSLPNIEVCLRRPDGTPIWVLESVHLLTEDGGDEVLEGTVIDITEQKKSEFALRASESRFRTLIEQMREGLVQVDLEGHIEYVNDRFCEMLGYTREELIGHTSSEFLLATDQDVERLNSKTALRLNGISDRYELRFRRKDGKIIWVEIGGAPITDAMGNVTGSIGVHSDITARRAAEQALRDSEARYRLMAENSTDLIARTTEQGELLYASDAIRTLLGYDPMEVLGHSIFEFVHPDDVDDVRRATRALDATTPTSFTYRARRREGGYVWFETTTRPITKERDGHTEFVSVSRDVSERKSAEEQIEYQAYHDALTGLPNRLLFRDRLTVALAHARRLHRQLGVMFLDLDRFKNVNDTLGHSAGDELLKQIAVRLRGALREEDTIARMGGDEFTVLVADVGSSDDVAKIAQKLLEVVAQPVSIEGNELFITTSIGIAVHPSDGDTAELLLKNADNAMYRAKDAGRNSYQLCTRAMNSRAIERLSLENALRRAIERGEFSLYYQPQLSLMTRAIAGMEALIRWNRPGHGVVSPATFVPIAEETRLIVPIGEWVLHEACRQAKRWQASRFPDLRIAVNLSPKQFQHSDLRRMITAALDATGLDPRSLELEITETTAMLNTDRTVTTLRELREMGVRIAIDDFGTGHSSLNYLRSFPIDRVKIDQAFVQEVERSRSDRAIVAAIIEMAHGLEVDVTAEGVETQPQLEFLEREGCHEVQGYLFGRPVPASAF